MLVAARARSGLVRDERLLASSVLALSLLSLWQRRKRRTIAAAAPTTSRRLRPSPQAQSEPQPPPPASWAPAQRRAHNSSRSSRLLFAARARRRRGAARSDCALGGQRLAAHGGSATRLALLRKSARKDELRALRKRRAQAEVPCERNSNSNNTS